MADDYKTCDIFDKVRALVDELEATAGSIIEKLPPGTPESVKDYICVLTLRQGLLVALDSIGGTQQ